MPFKSDKGFYLRIPVSKSISLYCSRRVLRLGEYL